MEDSQLYGLLNDFTKALGQQLYFWGCDVEYHQGNLLCEYGLSKTESKGKKSTSCYQMVYKGDVIELHGLCVGRYSKNNPSFLYTRQYRRCWIYEDESPVAPGYYDKSLIGLGPLERMEKACKLFLEWWLDYEEWISKTVSHTYRVSCYNTFRKLPTSKVWLPPQMGLAWLKKFYESSSDLKRSREFKKISA